ncbi:uncharacterized protein LOC125858849 [Solanum stenotomum]|uniref:uncharacterized protein LOC125858849 n=1 Tax=Solanum stenotomum TaxID=172797 RepID=UPI0020D1D307|nr:uncharacterized protein LOC125858849 [Solanum stenotomum]
MSDDKSFTTGIVLALSKITDNKLNGSNYLDWSRKIRVYLHSVEKDDHLIQDPPTDDTKKTWLRADATLLLQIINSIDNEVVDLVNHCEFLKELMDYLEYLYSGKGLPSEFETAKSHILSSSEISSLKDFFSRVFLTESTLSNQQTNVLVAKGGGGRNNAGRWNNNDAGRWNNNNDAGRWNNNYDVGKWNHNNDAGRWNNNNNSGRWNNNKG